MDRRRDTKRANVQVDRLSSLPNDLIHKILSLNGLKCAIGNSVLSSTWRYIWTSMPCLDFSSKDFSTLPKFLEYITNVLSRRDNLGYNDLSVGVFSECPNLKNLIIDSVEVKGLDVLDICHPLLSDLTLKYVMGSLIGFNVVAPQLKNLTIRHYEKDLQYQISAPDLSSLRYNGYYPLRLFTKGFSSLEKVYLVVYGEDVAYAHRMFRLLQQLQSAKFLTLSIEIVEVLSSSVELISGQPSPFTNLKMLKIYPENVDFNEQAEKKVDMSMEVKNYLLDGSPSATFILVSREIIMSHG
ncbi:F-box domain containing protein [Tanacetum coccineum]|uniref:F-box domain containing protein n=1 Tax=Tanacetum coccineum TaxID=301880 RepID=A0ABQ5C188_9ASTR